MELGNSALFLEAPEPVGYDPSIISAWESPTSDAFAILRLEPWRLRVFPGSVFSRQGGAVLNWRESVILAGQKAIK